MEDVQKELGRPGTEPWVSEVIVMKILWSGVVNIMLACNNAVISN